jgi:hypothetical protein
MEEYYLFAKIASEQPILVNKSYKYIAASEGYAGRPMHDSVYISELHVFYLE